jgi:hypothetical protein
MSFPLPTGMILREGFPLRETNLFGGKIHVRKDSATMLTTGVLVLLTGCMAPQTNIPMSGTPSSAFVASSTPLPTETVSILATTIANATKTAQEHDEY